ncbi:sugar phosphate isomerase/epimerase family protein [Actinopolyspora halophila]|uniref:sugar phosphate isomerase/epimerase family protein n=1 Tax=Actinopolyspora halophila TaxID=1850 RepID=UPI000364425A|nr:sugar phosphate isomerase/epimerase [Actinopolyspora halophila]
MNDAVSDSRRGFLRRAGTAALVVGASAVGAGTASANTTRGHGRHLPPSKIGMQLYSLRDAMGESVERTLSFLARTGYSEVEFAGLHGRSPERVRDLLRDLGLRTPSSHEDLPAEEDRLEQLFGRARTLGQRWVVLPYFAAADLRSYHRLAERLNRAGEIARSYGIRVGYHNHAHEFDSIDGRRPYDVLLDETDRRLVDFEVDLYWVVKAGVDPLDLFERAPRRFPLGHVKDMAADGSFADPGDGVIDFGRVFDANNRSGLRHFVVERDDQPHPRETAEKGYHYLRRIRF